MVEIPQDIIYNVIAAVGDDTRLLKRCALVSSSFLLPSRKQLFSRISLGSDETCQGIHQFLVQNPVIQPFVRSISLEHMSMPKTAKWMNGISLLAILRLPLCRLECFSIAVCRDFWTNWNWNSFSHELKDALSNIIHSSTLKTLYIMGITELPITFFLHIVHLTTLELHSLTPNDFLDENSSSPTPAASKEVAPMASHTVSVIDRCVWCFGAENTDYRTTELVFLPFLRRLRFLEIYIELYSPAVYDLYDLDILTFLIDSLCISLTTPATLEHLKFNIRFHDSTNDVDNPFYENFRDTWSHLDSITTHSTGSRLQRVDIDINYSFRHDIIDDDEREELEDEALKAVLDGLPLLRTKGILFVKTSLVDGMTWLG